MSFYEKQRVRMSPFKIPLLVGPNKIIVTSSLHADVSESKFYYFVMCIILSLEMASNSKRNIMCKYILIRSRNVSDIQLILQNLEFVKVKYCL